MKLVAGELASKYRLERQLGQGGMGSVWLASDARLGRRVAIKFLEAPLANAGELRSRLLREARTIATLRNEHIVDIYDVDVLDDDTPYIVMEFVSGDSLSAFRGRASEPGLIVDYILQSCIALAEAHAIGIVHRDIKPDNMIVAADSSLGPQLKLLDFGIAKAATTFSSADSFVTADNAVMGTPAYMSPEQTRSSQDIDARTDIWALGVVLYELIAGAPPFQGASYADVVAAILTREPAPLPAAIPRGLQAAIARCLAKDPTRRFANVAELAEALRPFAPDADAAARTVARCRDYLGLGQHVARTVVGVADPADRKRRADRPPGSPTTAGSPRITTTKAGEPWHALEAEIPSEMTATKDAVMSLFAQLFDASVAISAGVVRLIERDDRARRDERDERPAYDWFAIFMGNEQQDAQPAGVLGKATFAAYVRPLRAYLEELGSPHTKIAIVISASGELGEGVRATITEFRRELDTIVVPIWLREIERAHRQHRLSDIVAHRLHDLHARHNPFETPAADVDPMRYVGMGELVNQILVSLQTRRRVISILALPGSGKSTLIKLVQYSLPAREVVTIRCGDVANTVAGLGGELFAALDRLAGVAGAATAPDADVQEALAAKLDAVKQPRVPRERLAETLGSLHTGTVPIVVLEDADWFVAQIVEGVADARDLWVALGEMSARRKLDLMISSVRGGELERAAFGAWRNPVRPQSIAVPQLSLRDVSYLVAELGAGTSVFSDAAVAQLHAATKGHVGMLLALCGEAYRAARNATAPGPLDVVEVEAAHVAHAARRLAAVQRPIGTMFDAVLTADERHVLHALADRPRKLGHVRGVLSAPALGGALEGLEALGLVTHDGRRYAVTIPLLAAWARAHFAPAPAYAEGRWQRKTKLIAVGAALSAIIFATYVVLLRGQRTVSMVTAPDGCTYMADYPTRANYGTAVTVYVNRECAKPAPAQVRLAAYMSQSAITDVVEPGDKAGPCAASYCSYEKHLTLKEQASPDYVFKVTANDQEMMRFALERDSMAGLKDSLAQIMSMISALPVALALCLAFYTDLLKAIRGWWRRSPLAAPVAPPAE